MSLYYFAYGSNMSSRRLLARLPNAEKIGVAVLSGHRLGFDKAGLDGSGKCTIHASKNVGDKVYGVVYRIGAEEKGELDRIEGPRYDHYEVDVIVRDGLGLQAYCYIANTLDRVLLPFDWYLEHVYRGALEAGLPKAYLDTICAQAVLTDLNRERAEREFAIHGLSPDDRL